MIMQYNSIKSECEISEYEFSICVIVREGSGNRCWSHVDNA